MNLLTCNWRFLLWLVLSLGPASTVAAQGLEVDLSAYTPTCGVEVKRDGSRLLVSWPLDGREVGRLTLDLRSKQPLIERLSITSGSSKLETIVRGIEPLVFLTVGTRQAPPGRPPEMSLFNTFFDKPASRPYESYVGHLELRRARVGSEGHRASVSLGDMSIGPFSGDLVFT